MTSDLPNGSRGISKPADTDTEAANVLFEEVSSLQALYGDENVVMSQRNDGSGVHMISVNLQPLLDLERVIQEVITLSISVPANYPDVLPQSATLSVSNMLASRASHLVQQMLELAKVSSGSQCLFDYCHTMLDILHDELQISSPTVSSNFAQTPGSSRNSLSTCSQMANPSIDIDVLHCESFSERKSVFQAHACTVFSERDVSTFMSEVRSSRKGSIATHTMLTYRFSDSNGRVFQGHDDDGEKGGGKCMHNILVSTGAMDIAVAVSRWYGGIKLGPARFRIIARLTREAIDSYREHQKAQANAKSKVVRA